MSYERTGRGWQGRASVSYRRPGGAGWRGTAAVGLERLGRQGLGQAGPGLYGFRQGADLAMGVPGPMSPQPMGPGMASLFPTNVKWGDVVTVQIQPQMGTHQGSILVRFQGVDAIAPDMMSPYGGSVVVPVGAETGACTIEVDGRTVFGTNCVISRGLSGGGLPAQAPEHQSLTAWKHYTMGPGSALHGGSMPYFSDSYQGVGAIAAHDIAPRSAPAPTVGRLVTAKRQLASAIPSSPTLKTSGGIPVRPVIGSTKTVMTGVTVTKVGPSRPPIVVSGIRPSKTGLQPTTRVPTAPTSPIVRTPKPPVSIGTGIGSQTLAPSGGSTSSGITGGGSYGGGGGSASYDTEYTDEFDVDTLRPEFDEEPALVAQTKPKMSTGVKVGLAAAAVAAIYFLVIR